jgi:hypothetical protein
MDAVQRRLNMGIFGWDLPPGCSVRDLPGYGDCVYEVTIDGVHYAWKEDDTVYKYTGQHDHDYDDGYRLIGTLAWDDDSPEETLRNWLKTLDAVKTSP